MGTLWDSAGEFDQRVALQSLTSAQSSMGDEAGVWSTNATVWARVEPLRGMAYFAAGQAQRTSDHRITIRWRSGVSAGMRLLWRGEPYAIDAALDVGGKKERLELMCTKGVRDGR